MREGRELRFGFAEKWVKAFMVTQSYRGYECSKNPRLKTTMMQGLIRPEITKDGPYQNVPKYFSYISIIFGKNFILVIELLPFVKLKHLI